MQNVCEPAEMSEGGREWRDALPAPKLRTEPTSCREFGWHDGFHSTDEEGMNPPRSGEQLWSLREANQLGEGSQLLRVCFALSSAVLEKYIVLRTGLQGLLNPKIQVP